jgi:hypothetical protein
MATIQVIAFFNSAVIIEADYHDVQLRVQRVRCINSKAYDVILRLYDEGVLLFEVVLPPGITERSVAQGKFMVEEGGYFEIPYDIEVGVPSWL